MIEVGPIEVMLVLALFSLALAQALGEKGAEPISRMLSRWFAAIPGPRELVRGLWPGLVANLLLFLVLLPFGGAISSFFRASMYSSEIVIGASSALEVFVLQLKASLFGAFMLAQCFWVWGLSRVFGPVTPRARAAVCVLAAPTLLVGWVLCVGFVAPLLSQLIGAISVSAGRLQSDLATITTVLGLCFQVPLCLFAARPGLRRSSRRGATTALLACGLLTSAAMSPPDPVTQISGVALVAALWGGGAVTGRLTHRLFGPV